MSADSLGDYLKSIGQVSLLSADDEISLGHRVQAMLAYAKNVQKKTGQKQNVAS